MHVRRVGFTALVALALVSSVGAQAKDGQSSEATENRVVKFERQTVTVDDFPAQGLILDIGGGGEGVIGQLKGQQVVAVDLSKRELEEAPAGPLLKIVMDGTDLKFLDKTFDTVTVFFTFMYINSTQHEKVLKEAHRVLAPGGRMLIWDVVFPKRSGEHVTGAEFPLSVKLPKKEIRTGYGVHYPATEQGISHYVVIAESVGFEVLSQKQQEAWFFLELRKK